MSGKGNDRWPDGTDGDGMERLAQALEAGRGRGSDELLQRRLWSRVASPPPERRRRWGFSIATAGVGLGLVGATALLLAIKIGVPRTPPRLVARSAIERRMTPAAPSVVVSSEPAHVTAPAVLKTGRGETMKALLTGGTRVDLAPETQLDLDTEDRPVLRAGKVSLAVAHQQPGHKFAVLAGAYRVQVVGTRFDVSLSDERVDVVVNEGVVEVVRGDRMVRLVAGQSWSGANDDGLMAALEVSPGPIPSTQHVARTRHPEQRGTIAVASDEGAPDLARQARVALAAGDAGRALELLAQVARQSGPAAENALYESGRILRDELGKSRDALRVWKSYRSRYPRGLLRSEVDLSIVETLARMGERDVALAEADAFLAHHPASERRTEIATLAEALRDGRTVVPR